jgi:hypothetical protein
MELLNTDVPKMFDLEKCSPVLYYSPIPYLIWNIRLLNDNSFIYELDSIILGEQIMPKWVCLYCQKIMERESFIQVLEDSLDDQNEYHAWTRLRDEPIPEERKELLQQQ